MKKIIDKKELRYVSKKLKEVEGHITSLTNLGYIQELEGAWETKRKLFNRWLELKGLK